MLAKMLFPPCVALSVEVPAPEPGAPIVIVFAIPAVTANDVEVK
jgi:hypothetical protein